MGVCYSSSHYENTTRRSYKGLSKICKIYRVVDGDTIEVIVKLKNEPYYIVPIRVYGIDTPEKSLRSSNSPKEIEDLEVKAGIAVKEIVIEYVNVYSYAKVDFIKQDKYYGREIAKITLGTKNYLGQFKPKIYLSPFLLDNRLAVPYDGKKKEVFTEEFLNNILKNKKKIISNVNDFK
jgi:endonuclease YncB( thermonuclease family)